MQGWKILNTWIYNAHKLTIMKKILLVGRWGKTHAFAKAIVEKSPQKTELYCYIDKPNAGIIESDTD